MISVCAGEVHVAQLGARNPVFIVLTLPLVFPCVGEIDEVRLCSQRAQYKQQTDARNCIGEVNRQRTLTTRQG
eukprot:1496032-Rhodomonas_salina.2